MTMLATNAMAPTPMAPCEVANAVSEVSSSKTAQTAVPKLSVTKSLPSGGNRRRRARAARARRRSSSEMTSASRWSGFRSASDGGMGTSVDNVMLD